MKFIYTFVFLAIVIQANAQTIYVKPNGNGAGTSWSDAQSNLKTALDEATDGTQVWVAAGTYTPHNSDRNISFVLKSGVNILGGFPATGDPSLEDRNPNENPTILSGDIGLLNDVNDNSFTIIKAINPGNTTRIDGLVIANGHASEIESAADSTTYRAGGLYLLSDNGSSNALTIQNCMFSNNIAHSGAAIFTLATNNSTVIPVFENCMFTDNIAEFGGAIQNEASGNGDNNLVFSNCIFQNNESDETGGAMYNIGDGGNLSLSISKCAFYKNNSSVGGAIFNFPNNGDLTAEINNSIFYNNEAESGGAIDNFGFDTDQVNLTIMSCTFFKNSADLGGALSTFGGGVTINSTNSIFWNNTVAGEGATASNFAGGVTNFNYCLVEENTCSENGFSGNCNNMIFAENPLFIHPETFNFQLAACSPVLDMGTDEGISATDFMGNTRSFGSNIDLGAVEWNGSPAALSINTVTPIDISCNGQTDGRIELNITGGVEPYNIDTDLENLAAGTYSIDVIDAVGCSTSTTATIIEPSALSITPTVISDLTCFSINDGSASVEVTGGTAPYTYLWDNDETSEQAHLLSAGNHEVTATDANGCQITASVNLNAPEELTASASIVTQIACGEDGNGAASVMATGGTGDYTYLWSDGSTGTDLENLSIGEHCVTVTDANNCIAFSCVTLQGSEELTITPMITQEITCHGSASGAAMVEVIGGIEPYTYLWENGTTTAETTGLLVGNHTITVTDSNDCTAAITVTLEEPAFLDLSLNIDNEISCAGDATGQISLNISGGTEPYTFQWNDNQTTSTVANLGAGEYHVTIIDANNCITSDRITLEEPAMLSSEIVITQELLCFGNDNGAATIMTSGGTAPYTYAWANDTEGINLQAGTHQVSITDANACEEIAEITLTQPNELLVEIEEIIHISETGTNDGSINILVSGGTGNYTFDWDNGIGDIQNPTELSPGTYTVLISDENGCMTTTSAVVADPNIVTITGFNTTNVTCNGGMDGGVEMTIFGGTMPYTYDWSGGIDNVQNPSNLIAGTYQVVITDANGSMANASVEITQPTAIEITDLEVSDIACDGSGNGRIAVVITGGVPPYAYDWGEGIQDSPSIENLTSGTYQVTIYDANDCSITSEPVLIVLETNLELETSVTAPTCAGENDGTIAVNVTGGTAPYLFLWSGGAPDPTNFPAGDYGFTITDANGCMTEGSATVPATPELIATTTSTDDNGTGIGTATVMAEGGTPPYTYNWVDANMQTTQTIVLLEVGTYTVIVTDANGCTLNATAEVTLMSSNNEIEALENLSIFPNPTAGDLTIALELSNTANTQITVFDAIGRAVLTLPTAPVKAQDYQLDLSALTSGVYMIRIAIDGQILGRKILVE